MTTIDQGNNFENPFWNLIQVLAWIYSKNINVSTDDAITKVLGETFKRETPHLDRSNLTWADKEYDQTLNQVNSEELRERIKQQVGAPNWFDDIEDELIQALQTEEVICCGLENNKGQPLMIPSIQWVDLRFWYETPLPFAGPKEYFRSGGTRWYGLEFPTESIQKVWLTPNSVNSRKDQEEQTDFPLDTKWEDMTWTFLSNELVRVEAKGISKKYNYTDLGFTDRRKGDTCT